VPNNQIIANLLFLVKNFLHSFFLVLIIPPPFITPTHADDSPKKSLPIPGEVFLIEEHVAFLIPPAVKPSTGPILWVWYAPTLPNLPGPEEKWMFDRWTKAGLGIAGIDVGESYGSPDGQRLFSALFHHLTKNSQFSPKPILLGRSRGGLMTLAWAAANPQNVGGFAGIYPVCNLISFPGLDKACSAYQLTSSELAAQIADYNPIDRLSPLAKANVPLFIIHGDNDKVVPLSTNSGELSQRYETLGGKIHMIIPRGQGHNMWEGFFQSPELLEFVISTAKSTATPLASP